MLQAEFALTQVFDRPLSGRYVFEELIRENLDLGRPDRVSLIFNRRVTKRTPSRFNTRVITEGVMPSLHVSYKNSKIKQYFKEDKALRTEMTINNARDFAIGKKLGRPKPAWTLMTRHRPATGTASMWTHCNWFVRARWGLSMLLCGRWRRWG